MNIIKLPGEIEDVCRKITVAGHEISIVGGAVRDFLSGKDIVDWDLTTSAKPEEISKLFKASFYNNKFGTVGINTKECGVVEVTTYRFEKGYSDSRHPDEISWGKNLEEDLKRRDFTINALAITFPEFKIIDLFGGQSDLKKKLIKTVGIPGERFKEDALRLLRAVRFAAVLDFEIEQQTLDSILKNAQLLEKVSGERIREELFKIIESKNAAEGIFLLKKSGLLKYILPELDVCFDVPQKSPKRHHIYDVGTHCVMSLKFTPSGEVITRFATLLHDVGKAKVADVTEEGVRTFYNHEVVGSRQAVEIAQRLHLSKDQREKLFKLVRWHQFSVGENQTDASVRRFIKNVGLENVPDMLDLRVGDRLGGGLEEPESWRLKLFKRRIDEVLKKPFSVSDLKINGKDVMEILSLKPGPKIGEVLNSLFDEVAEDKGKNTKEYLMGRLEELKNSNSS